MSFNPDELTTNLLRNNEPMPIPHQNLRVRTWFLENQRGEVVAVDESAAWHMIQPNQNIGSPKPVYKIVGVSMANIYSTAVENIKNVPSEEKKAYLKKAFDEEVVEARKNIIYPRNPNIMDKNGNPTNATILNQMK